MGRRIELARLQYASRTRRLLLNGPRELGQRERDGEVEATREELGARGKVVIFPRPGSYRFRLGSNVLSFGNRNPSSNQRDSIRD